MKAQLLKRMAVIFVAFASTAIAQTFTNGDWLYSLDTSNEATVVGYIGTGGAVVVPNTLNNYPVRHIGNGVFFRNNTIESVQCGTNLVSVGNYAFAECAQLTNAVILQGTLGESAFAGAYGVNHRLSHVTLGDGVTDIGNFAFANCNALASINVPGSVKRIGVEAFIYCSSLKSATVGLGVTNISDSAFKLCPSLLSVLFIGNAPSAMGSGIFDFSFPTVYYYANTSGWTSSFAGRPTVALVGSSYANSLTNQSSLLTDFSYLQIGSGGSLSALTNGLSLSTAANEFAAGYWLKQNLPSVRNWTATVKCHVSKFSADQINPWFYGALALIKNGFTEQDIASNPMLELKLVRTGENGLTNSVSWKNNSQDGTFYQDKLLSKDAVTDLFLSYSYVAENTTLSANISGDGVIFTNLTRWNLGEAWGVTAEDVFTVLVGAGNQPYGGVSATHQVQQGDIYLRDLSVSFDTSSGSSSTDTDADGLSDLAEQSLASLGFDWRVPQPQLVASFMANAPSAGLFTQTQYDANRIAGISEGRAQVTGNPAGYGLYTSNSIMDLRMGGLMIQKQGTNAVVSFQPQTTTDIATQPFTNSGTPITNSIPMPGNKGFIRINAKP